MNRSLVLLSILTLTLLSACKSSKNDQINFALDLPEGHEMQSTVKLTSVSSIRVGIENELSLNATAELSHKAHKNGDQQVIALTLDDMNVDYSVKQKFIQTSDSDMEGGFDGAEIAKDYLGKTVDLVYDEHARIQRIEGLDEIAGKGTTDSIEAAMINAQTLLGENFIERLVTFLAVLPTEPVSVGESWENVLHQEVMGLPIQVDAQYKLVGRENGVATIEIDGKMITDTAQFNLEDFEFPLEGIQGFEMAVDNIRIHLKGDHSGTVRVNEETGWTESSMSKQDVKIQFQIGLFTLPIELKNTVEVSPR